MGIKDIFHVPSSKEPENTKPTPEEQEVMDKLAKQVVRYGLTLPAILFLESVKPLNYIGSQALVFFEPFWGAIFDLKDYSIFRKGMEKRYNVENFLLTIEKFDAEAQQKEREFKKQQKANRKSWRDRFPFSKKSKN